MLNKEEEPLNNEKSGDECKIVRLCSILTHHTTTTIKYTK